MRAKEFNALIASIRQAGRIRRGQLKPGRVLEFGPTDVKAIRLKLKKSQSEFALMIGVSAATLRNWEQGRRRPEGPARALLTVAAENPRAVERALNIDAPTWQAEADQLRTRLALPPLTERQLRRAKAAGRL